MNFGLHNTRNRQKKTTKQKPQNHRPTEHQTSKKPFDLRKTDKQSDRCIRCGNTIHVKGFQCPARKFQCKVCHKFGHFTTVCCQKNQQTSSLFKPRKPKAHQLQAGAYTLIKMVIVMSLKSQIPMNHSVYR